MLWSGILSFSNLMRWVILIYTLWLVKNECLKSSLLGWNFENMGLGFYIIAELTTNSSRYTIQPMPMSILKYIYKSYTVLRHKTFAWHFSQTPWVIDYDFFKSLLDHGFPRADRYRKKIKTLYPWLTLKFLLPSFPLPCSFVK